MNHFTEIAPSQIAGSVFDRIGKEWMLVTAGDRESCNTMTASWGGLGVLWNKPVAFLFVRPTRYTYTFLEREDNFSLSFFGDTHREALTLCGRTSGRDGDKIAATGLTVRQDAEAPYFDEAQLVLVCRKLYVQDMTPDSFLDKELITAHYHDDFHRVYVGEIKQVLQRNTENG